MIPVPVLGQFEIGNQSASCHSAELRVTRQLDVKGTYQEQLPDPRIWTA
jgi:hypothetical protein